MRKAKRKGQRVLAAALCVGMLASMVPAQAFANDEPTTAIVQQEETSADADTPVADADAEQTPAPTEAPAEETPAPTEAPAEETPAPTEAPAEEETETPASDAATQEGEATDAAVTTTHIATTVGKVPAALEGVEGVTEDTFKTAFETVKVAKDGVTYTVEVIPADTVYFIDSVAAASDKNNGVMADVQTTEAYDAAKALLGDQLLNDKFDQFYQGDATWGLVDTDAQTKGYIVSGVSQIADKTYTGIYGKNNEKGETISYNFTLPAGKYTITTAHREWWGGQNRAMDLSLTTTDGTSVYTTVPKQNNGNVTIKTGEFTITTDQVVTWTATATGTHAPAVSWLAIERTGDVETSDTPDENENFGKALEDNDLITVRTGASLAGGLTPGKWVSVTTGWISGGNSAVDGGGAVKDADSFFKRSSFTLYADIKFNDAHDNTSAILVGPAADANFRIIPRKNDGTAVLTVNNNKEYKLSKSLEAGEWNALALVYNENDTEGTVAVYLNGEEVLAATGVGFKLSEKTGIIGAFGATFGTGFMRTGLYDNIVVTEAAEAEAAKTETAARKEALANIPDVDGVVALNGSEVETAAQNKNGWTYKGFGLLNGNSTSNLLLDYKAENPQAYWAMMKYLFGSDDGYPLFSNIKMEMGNDGDNSTGADSCTMRYEDEEADASRSPGFVMAADAKKINPNVKISILRWEYPNWIANKSTTQEKYAAIYKWYKETIFDAYEKYGYVIDYIDPDKNETQNPDGEIIKYFANALKNEDEFPNYFTDEAIAAYHNIKIVASDENKTLNIVPKMLNDQELYDAVDAIGFHYRTTATSDYIKMADVNDKEVWYSEGCATFGYSELQENKTTAYGAGTIGGYQSPLALLDSLPNAFIGSRRTLYMFQPAIGAFYEGIEYGHKELLSARDPWSGYIHYDPALYMLAHITQFAKTGWENETNTNGIWRVLPNATFASFGANDNEHATAGIDGNASYMTLAAPDKQDFSTVFINNTQNEKTFAVKVADDMDISVDALNVWTTETDNYLQAGEPAAIENGIAYVTVPAYSVVTATTLDTTPARFPTEKDNNGDYIQTEKRTVLDTDSTGKNPDTTDDYLYADNFNYKEEGDVEQYRMDGVTSANGETTEVPYLTARGNEPRYMLDTHGAWIVENGQLKQENSASVNEWRRGEPTTIVGDWRWMDYSASIDVTLPNADSSRYERLTIRSQTGMYWTSSGYTLEINGAGSWKLFRAGTQITNGTVTKNAEGKYNLKLIGLGDTVYAYIDDVRVASYTDATPMLSGRVKISSNWKQVYADNLEVKTIEGGIPYATAMIDGQDDTVTYEGNWAINNPGGGSADNWYRTISSSSTAGATVIFPINGNGFAIMGKNDGSAVIDVYVDGELKAKDATTKAAPLRGEAYILADLPAGQHTVKVELKSGTLAIDALNTIGARKAAADDVAIGILTQLPNRDYYLTGSTVDELPATVEVKMGDGSVKSLPVKWDANADALAAKAYSSVTVNGTVEGVINPLGDPLTAVVTIKEVIPGDTLYFIDSVSGKITDVAGGTTDVYEIYKKALGDQLLNKTFDQFKTDATTWGLVDTDAGTKSYSGTADKTATGIYGKNNAAGETLTYALTLPAGTYTLTSAHHEWWGYNRPMTAVVTDADNKALSDTATLNLSGSSGDIINKANFTLDEEQTVYYTVTATSNQAPVISWLAVNGKASTPSTDAARAKLTAKIEEIRAALAADKANGINYATKELEAWQYTGNKAGTVDTLPALEEALKAAEELAKDENATNKELNNCTSALTTQYKGLRTLPETYTNIPGTAATVIKADTGLPMQAHGGSAMTLKEGIGDGCVNYDLDGDGSITEGKTVYLWFGEDKTNSTRPVDGVRCYSSTDLYNWTDHGTILYTQSTILPVEEGTEKAINSSDGANGTGTTQEYNVMQFSKTNLETLKAWGKLSAAPDGVTESEFRNVKNFLRAYVTEYETAPKDLNDISWTAKSYDEDPITASSLLYPDSTDEKVRNVTTTRLQLAFETLYGNYCVTERPKMIYNESTKQFVLIWHADGPLYNTEKLYNWVKGGCVGNCPASRYGRAMVGIATSDSPFGPFTVQNVTRMNYDISLNANRLGEARDMTVFVDTGVDKNNDGADDAYVIYSSEMNAKLYVSLLNKDYTGLAAEADQADATQFAARIVSDNSREAPAMFKYNGYYYLLTSGTDGWNSTAHTYYRSKDVLSGWEKIGNPAKNDTGRMFNTQVTYVLPVDAEAGKFIYMGDRWNGDNLTDSRTIWLPIQMNTNNTLSVLGEKNWTLDRLDQLLPTTVNTELPEVVWSDGSNLPETVDVTTQGKNVTSKVEWDTDSLKNFGTVSVTGTLTDCGNISISTTATVVPKNLLYFANPTKDPVSSDYTAIVKASAETLKNSAVNDGVYNAENGFGYTGNAGTICKANGNIYESMRYAANKDSVTYRFDNLTEGGYTVYIGMFNPTGWVESGKTRLADIKINGKTVQTGYNYNTSCTGKGDTLAFTGLDADENGTLTVEVAANANTNVAVQVSFIMVAAKPAVDTDKLEKAVEENTGKDETEYTEASWKAFNEALEAAKKVLDDDKATQDDVDAALKNLNEAASKLEKKPEVKKDALDKAIEDNSGKSKDDYTEDSWTKFEDALKAAQDVQKKADATQNEVDAAVKALNEAAAGLVKKPEPVKVDKTALDKAIKDNTGKSKDDYTEDSWTKFEDALKAAQDVQKKADATQNEVDAAVKALNEAAAGLVKKPEPVKVDKTALDKAIKDNSGKSKDDYTEDSWTKFDKAMTNAQEVQKNDKATQDEVDAAVKALNEAAAGLVKKPEPPVEVDKKALDKAIKDNSGKTKDDYTEDSWNKFDKAMTNAQNVLDDETATQDDVDAAVKALNEATAGLVKKPEPVKVDKTALDKAIKDNSGKSKDDYTEDSWNKFDKAMTNAQEVQKNDKATQEEVDAAVKALTDAAKALEKKPAPTEKPTATPAPTSKPNNSNSNNNNSNSTSNSAASTAKPSQATPAPASTRVPQTSDSFPIVPLAAVALLSLNGLIVLILRKREKHK